MVIFSLMVFYLFGPLDSVYGPSSEYTAKLTFLWYYNFGENQILLQRNGMAAIPKIPTNNHRFQFVDVDLHRLASTADQCDQIWPFVAILAIFGGVWQQFFCQKSPVKSFDVDIFGFGKFIYVLWRQIWRFLPKCWRLFGPNTWSHCCRFKCATTTSSLQ